MQVNTFTEICINTAAATASGLTAISTVSELAEDFAPKIFQISPAKFSYAQKLSKYSGLLAFAMLPSLYRQTMEAQQRLHFSESAAQRRQDYLIVAGGYATAINLSASIFAGAAKFACPELVPVCTLVQMAAGTVGLIIDTAGVVNSAASGASMGEVIFQAATIVLFNADRSSRTRFRNALSSDDPLNIGGIKKLFHRQKPAVSTPHHEETNEEAIYYRNYLSRLSQAGAEHSITYQQTFAMTDLTGNTPIYPGHLPRSFYFQLGFPDLARALEPELLKGKIPIHARFVIDVKDIASPNDPIKVQITRSEKLGIVKLESQLTKLDGTLVAEATNQLSFGNLAEMAQATKKIDASFSGKEIAKKQITAADIDSFAEISGDYNLPHIDNDYMKKQGLKGRVLHGMFWDHFVSGLLTYKERLIGKTTTKFCGLTYVDDTVRVFEEVSGNKLKITLVNQDDVIIMTRESELS